MFKENSPLYSFDIVRESGENVAYVNYLGANYVPNLADYFDVMARTVDLLMEDSNISRIVYVQQRNYSHNFEQVNMLIEVAQLYNHLTKQEKVVSIAVLEKLGYFYEEAYSFLNYIINEVLKGDPVRAYRELKGALFEQRALSEKGYDNINYLRLIEKIINSFDRLLLIQNPKSYLTILKLETEGFILIFLDQILCLILLSLG